MIAELERVVTLLVNGALARLMPGWRRAHAADRGPARWPESDQGASLGAVDLAEAEPVLVAPPVKPQRRRTNATRLGQHQHHRSDRKPRSEEYLSDIELSS